MTLTEVNARQAEANEADGLLGERLAERRMAPLCAENLGWEEAYGVAD